MIRSFLLFALLTMMVLAVAASGQNLVSNPSFATGDFTGWTTHTCTGSCTVQGWGVVTSLPTGQIGAPPSGTTAAAVTACVGAACNNPTTGDDLSQTLTTVPGQTYTLTFYYNPGSSSGVSGTTELDVLWNGVAVSGAQLINEPAVTWHIYSFVVTATSTSTVLEFTGRQDPATLYLTAISVTAGGIPGTPIPTTWVLMVVGLIGVTMFQTRERFLNLLRRS